MAVVTVGLLIAVVLAGAWVVGEVKNIRALRVSGILVPMFVIPFAYEIGVVIGHGRAYVFARSATGRFLDGCMRELEDGQKDRAIAEMNRAHSRLGESEKFAGQFFMDLENSITTKK